jgi:chaperonin GroEL
MSKLIVRSKDIEDKILEAVDIITDPIKQTMSPKGGNVLFENAYGTQSYTNDGVTIAKNISVKDPIVNQTISVIKESSLKTNSEAGDGTSSTILLSSVLIKEGLNLLRNGWNPIDIRNEFVNTAAMLKTEVAKHAHQIKNDEDLFFIANVSSSNDEEVAKNTVKTIKITGKEGQVLINPGYTQKTELVEDSGFILKSGIFTQELAQNKTFNAKYDDVPVFVTDKRLYYPIEAEMILSTALKNGHKSIVVIASDFIGDALPFFVENHQKGIMNILLIKESKPEILADLAIYLDTEVISDKSGALDKLTMENYGKAKMIFSNVDKTIVSRYGKKVQPQLSLRISEIEKEMKSIGNKESGDYKKLEERLASLTRGMVTIKVGGSTHIEVNEKIFRYEDAINATRAALDDGYVAGGGVTLIDSWGAINKKKMNSEIVKVFDKYASCVIKQILTNCGESVDVFLDKISNYEAGYGYNANTGSIENMVESGIIEPTKVIMQAIDNSISIANAILTSRYRIVNQREEEINNKNK